MPTGRAFKGPVNGWMDGLNNALAISENKAYTDALSTFDSMLADNANFTVEDATDWERRLGLINGTGLPLQARIQLILQQYNFPGTTLPRAFWKYIQDQLQLAGFNVWVYENRFVDIGGHWVTKNPATDFGGIGVSAIEHGLMPDTATTLEHGDAQHGGIWNNIVANYIDLSIDINFSISPNLRSTFFIGGPTLGSYAYVPTLQMQQFRHLILKLKPTQTIAYLLVVYT